MVTVLKQLLSGSGMACATKACRVPMFGAYVILLVCPPRPYALAGVFLGLVKI